MVGHLGQIEQGSAEILTLFRQDDPLTCTTSSLSPILETSADGCVR